MNSLELVSYLKAAYRLHLATLEVLNNATSLVIAHLLKVAKGSL